MKLSRKDTQGEFTKKVEDLSGENVNACYQCGKCSAGCPVVDHMDILPHTVIRFLQLGDKDKVLYSETIWICATCLQCSAKCPKGVGIAEIMDALRIIAQRSGIDKIEIKKITEEMWRHLPQQGLVSGFRKFSS